MSQSYSGKHRDGVGGGEFGSSSGSIENEVMYDEIQSRALQFEKSCFIKASIYLMHPLCAAQSHMHISCKKLLISRKCSTHESKSNTSIS